MSESNLYHAMISDEKSYGFGWSAGQQAERKRIIKLLEDYCDGNHSALDNCDCSHHIHRIKGENK